MSVFDLPRLHFRGTAITRLPTGPHAGLVDLATNQALTDEGPFPVDAPVADYHNYLDRRGPRYDSSGRINPNGAFSASKGWNFAGNGHFWIDARIVSAEGLDGVDVEDPVVGRAVDMWGHYNEYLATTANRARVFDVDPTSNWTTTVMVGQFGFGRSGRSHDTGYMLLSEVSGLQPPRWLNFHYIADVGEHVLAPQLRRCVLYQFALPKDAGLSWLRETAVSPITTLLRSVVSSDEVDGVVVQFALSNMAAPVVPDAPDRWHVRGTIAPWQGHELRTYPAGRLLTPRRRPCTGLAGLHNLTVALGAERVTLNLITAVPLARGAGEAGAEPVLGPRVDLGELELRTAGTARLIARIPATAYLAASYELTSGIVAVPREATGDALDDEPLCLARAGRQRVVLLDEEEINLQVDDACLFLEHPQGPGDDEHRAEVLVRSVIRGRPGPVEQVHIRQFVNPRSRALDRAAATARCGDLDIVAVRAGRADGSGPYAPTCVTDTDEQGRGWFAVRGVRAGATRILLTAQADDLPCEGSSPGSAARAYDNADALGYWAGAGWVAARVLPDDWQLDRITGEVSFELVYREVFAYYELLYSFMKAEVFSLADACKVKTYARLIWQMCDPRNKTKTYYMPPTRDLSEPKARLLLQFFRAQQAVTDIPVLSFVPRPPSGAITRRGQLWAALRCAATIELAVMLQYLYAAYSVPSYGAGCEHVRRGLWTPEQLRLACGDGAKTQAKGVRDSLLTIAREEMIHFLVVNNIIMAMGEAFYVPTVNFGTINSTLPIPLDFALEGLSLASVQRFIAIEKPADQIGEVRYQRHSPVEETRSYGSLSELYSDIRDGLQNVPDLFMVEPGRGGGEHHLFLRRSINAAHPDYQLEVDDLPSALFAIDFVTEQGEGNKLTSLPPSGESHFEMFLRISELLMAEQATSRRSCPPWSLAYPVPRNPSLYEGNPNTELITDTDTRAVMHLFNRSYFMMFQLMLQHFGQTPDASLRRSKLMNAAIDVMTGMMCPLGELLVTMPSGHRGKTAGPSFELEEAPQFNSRPDVAMRSIVLRFQHLAEAAGKCDAVPERVADMFSFYAEYFRYFT